MWGGLMGSVGKGMSSGQIQPSDQEKTGCRHPQAPYPIQARESRGWAKVKLVLFPCCSVVMMIAGTE